MTSFVLPRVRRPLVLLVALVLLLVGVSAFSATPARADANPEYDSVPAIAPPSYVSLGYQATSTPEFGDHIQLAGTDRVLDTVTVGLTNWACESDYTLSGSTWTPAGGPCTSTPGSSFEHPITLNIYGVDTSGVTPVRGALLATLTDTFDIPFRPSASPGVGPGLCGAGATQWYNAGTGTCHNGFGFTITFDFSALGPILVDDLIVAVAYNTQSYGAAPIGAAGPYNSLNVSLADDAPTAGTDVDADLVFWNTSHAPFYSDAGASGVGTLRADTGWGDYNGLVLRIQADAAIQAPTLGLGSATPAGTLPATGTTTEPIGFALLLLAAGGVLLVARCHRRA